MEYQGTGSAYAARALEPAAARRMDETEIPPTTLARIRSAARVLLDYCRDNDWAGFDPYDALNSRILEKFPILDRKAVRLVLIQLLKRSPINLRKPLRVPKSHNPKGLALVLSALLKMNKLRLGTDHLLDGLILKIAALRSQGMRYWCWGYNFPWQTRSPLVPRGAPNLVSTVFVANALFDCYESTGRIYCLEMALSAAEYLLNELYWTDGGSAAGYDYPLKNSRTQVHNANFLGAALLARAFRHTGERRFVASALRVARYSVSRQHAEGFWYYGEHAKQKWIDNFHTGYNLCALSDIGRYAETAEFDDAVQRGFDFYIGNYFATDGSVKYFHDRLYPLDIHCIAQSLITLIKLRERTERAAALSLSVLNFSLARFRDSRGYFYYQITPYYKNKIPYMRWSQAWMLLALAAVMEAFGTGPIEKEAIGCGDGYGGCQVLRGRAE